MVFEFRGWNAMQIAKDARYCLGESSLTLSRALQEVSSTSTAILNFILFTEISKPAISYWTTT